MRTGHCALVGLICAGLALPALASPPVAGGKLNTAGVSSVMPASACSKLFGDRQARSRSAARRSALLDFVDEDDGGVTVAHTSNRWGEPIRLRLEGLKMRHVAPSTSEVVVEVSETLATTMGCHAGAYRLRIDDQLAVGTRILAVLHNGLLLEHGRKLGFVGGRSPRWLMAWRMEGVEVPFVRNPRILRRRGIGRIVY